MITVKRLIAELSKYPEDALCYAYEGEIIGIIIVELTTNGLQRELGEIEAKSDGCCGDDE